MDIVITRNLHALYHHVHTPSRTQIMVFNRLASDFALKFIQIGLRVTSEQIIHPQFPSIPHRLLLQRLVR